MNRISYFFGNFNIERIPQMRRVPAAVLIAFALTFATTATAQPIKPRRATPAAPAPAQPSADQPPAAPTTEPTAPAAPAAGTLVISASFPTSVEASRPIEISGVTVTGGTAPYKWNVNRGNLYYENEEGNAGNYFSATEAHEASKEPVEIILSVTDSSKPVLTGERKFKVLLTPRVATLKDLDDQLRNLQTSVNDTLTTGKFVDHVKATDLAAKSVSQQLGNLNAREERLNWKTNYLIYGGIALAVLLLVNIFIGVRIMRNLNNRIASIVILFVLASLGSTNAFAQAAKPAGCTITSVRPQVIIKEQDAVEITIRTRNCSDIDLLTAGVGLTFTDAKAGTNSLTAKVAADANAPTGPTGFKIILKDKTEVDSPDKVYLRVLDMQTADVRNELTRENTALRAGLKAQKSAIDILESRINALNTELTTVKNRPTMSAADVKTIVAGELQPLNERLGNMERAQVEFLKQVDNVTKATAQLQTDTGILADNMPKKNKTLGLFGGKRDPMVVAIADRYRTAINAANAAAEAAVTTGDDKKK